MAKSTSKFIESDSNTSNFHFFCINTTLNDYHFCWALNEALTLNLTRIENISLDESSMQKFSAFRDITSNPLLSYSLISLKSENALLMKDLVSFDFLLCIDGEIDEVELINFQTGISNIKNVLLVTRLENQKTKPTTIADLCYLMEMIG